MSRRKHRSKLEDLGCDNLLRGQGCRTPLGVVMNEHGTIRVFLFFFFLHYSPWWTLVFSKYFSIVLGPATNVSNSSRPCSLDLPQLTQTTST